VRSGGPGLRRDLGAAADQGGCFMVNGTGGGCDGPGLPAGRPLRTGEEGMKKLVSILALLLATLIAAPAGAQENWTGDWHGSLVTPRGQLRLLLTIRAGENGALTAELESVDQAPGQKIRVATVAVASGRLTFAVPSFSLTYDGT